MQTTFVESFPGYCMLSILFVLPCIWFIRTSNKKSVNGQKHGIEPMELIFLILMPVLGLWFYNILVDGRPEQYDWKYYSAIGIIPVIIGAYFMSRLAKNQLHSLTKKLLMFLLIMGICIAGWMVVHFYNSVGAVAGMMMFSPLILLLFFAFPYYSLFTVILLLIIEWRNLFISSKHNIPLNTHHEK